MKRAEREEKQAGDTPADLPGWLREILADFERLRKKDQKQIEPFIELLQREVASRLRKG